MKKGKKIKYSTTTTIHQQAIRDMTMCVAHQWLTIFLGVSQVTALTPQVRSEVTVIPGQNLEENWSELLEEWKEGESNWRKDWRGGGKNKREEELLSDWRKVWRDGREKMSMEEPNDEWEEERENVINSEKMTEEKEEEERREEKQNMKDTEAEENEDKGGDEAKKDGTEGVMKKRTKKREEGEEKEIMMKNEDKQQGLVVGVAVGGVEVEEGVEVVWVWIVNTTTTTTTTTNTPPHHNTTPVTVTTPTTRAARQQDTVEGAATNLTLEIRSHTHTLTLDVYANRELLAKTYQDPGVKGRQVNSGDGGGQMWCEYLGKVRGDPASLVAVSVCAGLRGVVYTAGQWTEVYPAPDTHTLRGPHLLDNTSTAETPTCSVGSGARRRQRRPGDDSVVRRRTERSLRGDWLWIQRNTSFVELVVVVDNTLYQQITSSTKSDDTATSVGARVRAITNVVNALYRPLGIVVVLTHLDVWSGGNKVEVVDKDSNATLDNFKEYLPQFQKDNPGIPVDNMQLLTGVHFEGNTVGKGTVSGMCGPSSVGVSMDGGLRSIMGVAETMTHEMGHNFGLNHVDEVSGCECKERDCIMLSSGMGIHWSECSRTNITRLLSSLALECLHNAPTTLATWDGSTENCGNGVREDGEECDCGPAGLCDNPCCDAETCRFATNATCATGPCCDVATCRPQLSTWVVCRDAHSECDVPEYCDGRTEECAADSWVRDGAWCDSGKGHCYQGVCGSAASRCMHVWGPDATPCASELQSHFNVRGDKNGNCGYGDRQSEELKPCAAEDARCGTLFCHTSKEDTLGWYFYRTVWVSEDSCRAVVAQTTYDGSAWLVPNGSPCGDGKMCVDQYCVGVPTPLATIIFWVVVVVAALLTLLLWDHIRYWWERQGGHACCHTHLYYCAACLDACCCPCMNRLNRLVLSVVPPLRCPCGRSDCLKRSVHKLPSVVGQNGDVVCNGSVSVGGGEGASRGTGEGSEEWDVREDIVKFATKGVTLRPVTPPPVTHPSVPASRGEVPLLHPIHDLPFSTHSLSNPRTDGVGQFSMPQPPQQGLTEMGAGFGRDNLNPAPSPPLSPHAHTAPVRPAPPPPVTHSDTHQSPVHRPIPTVPPRPITRQPLQPTLSSSPPTPYPPPQLTPAPLFPFKSSMAPPTLSYSPPAPHSPPEPTPASRPKPEVPNKPDSTLIHTYRPPVPPKP